MGARSRLRRGLRLALAGVAALAVSAPARGEDAVVAPEAPAAHVARDLATLASREALLGEQAGTARASLRWRLGALYRLALASPSLPPASRARAVDAAAHAFARALAEERALATESARAHAERAARVEAGAAEPAIGAAPALLAPTAGAVLAKFGVVPDRDTGLLVSRAGVRLAAQAGQAVAAPAACTVAAVAAEPEGTSVVLDLGEGWTAILGGLGETTAAPGQAVPAGQALGTAAGPVTFEVWRGRRPVDPMLLLRRTPPPRPLAAAPPLP